MSVHLVGAGPGDPGLLTLAAYELLQRADVVVHDRLVDERTLALARPGAELVDVGKAPYGPGASQKAINELLVERGRRETVVRLKGGDPYVFGRGGEEAAALAAAGVDYEVVPGVPSLAAVPAAAGVPLTYRGVTSTIVALTGHDPQGATSAPVDWAALGAGDATLVVVMGAAQRAQLTAQLLAHGRAPETPVLVVERGTTPEQRSQRSTLADLAALEFDSPATIVVGEVARLALASAEDRALHGWRVLVTRPAHEAGGLATGLARLGARPLLVSTIEIAPASDGGRALEAAIARLGAGDWVVLTSSNAVEALFARLADARALAGTRVAAVGPSTAATLAGRGVRADLVAEPPSTAGLLAGFPAAAGRGRVLYPRASLAPDELAAGLSQLGYEVEAPVAYETRLRGLSADERALARGADAVLLTSGSAVRGLLEALAPREVPSLVVTIGAATSAAARALGLRVSAVAPTPDSAGILSALVGLAEARRSAGGGGEGAAPPR